MSSQDKDNSETNLLQAMQQLSIVSNTADRVPESPLPHYSHKKATELALILYDEGWTIDSTAWILNSVSKTTKQVSEEDVMQMLEEHCHDPRRTKGAKSLPEADRLIEAFGSLGIEEGTKQEGKEEENNGQEQLSCPIAFQAHRTARFYVDELHETHSWDVSQIQSFLEVEIDYKVSVEEIKQYLKWCGIEPYVYDYPKRRTTSE